MESSWKNREEYQSFVGMNLNQIGLVKRKFKKSNKKLSCYKTGARWMRWIGDIFLRKF